MGRVERYIHHYCGLQSCIGFILLMLIQRLYPAAANVTLTRSVSVMCVHGVTEDTGYLRRYV